MPCPERNLEISQRQQMSAEKKEPQEKKPNHLLLETSYKQLLQAQTEWIQLLPSELDSVCPPGCFWLGSDQD